MPLNEHTKLRRVIFRPYRKGMGPTFTLVTWDANARFDTGQHKIGYRLTMISDRLSAGVVVGKRRTVVFEGEDCGVAPSNAIDSDSAIEGCMTFLTLRPGDTDADYFEGYTDVQKAFCDSHAETLSGEISARYQCFECGSFGGHVRTVDGYQRKVCDSHRRARKEG